MPDQLRIIFMGTPDFAVPTLQILVENNLTVVAVITAPDRPSGRGLKLTESPVKQYALSQNIPVLQPEKLKNSEFLDTLRSFHADVQVVVAFRMLPELVWNMPRLGTFNLHASLLPNYRGAAPINWAIMNGETETGLTTFFIEKDIDTGKIIFQEEEPIHPEDTAGTLYERLMHKGANLVLQTVQAIENGKYPHIPQPELESPKGAPKLFRENCEIDWMQPVSHIRNFVRGLSPYPTAWTTLNGLICKIFEVEIQMDSDSENKFEGTIKPGDFQTDHKNYLKFRALNGWVSVIMIQIEGKRRMPIEELLRGLRL